MIKTWSPYSGPHTPRFFVSFVNSKRLMFKPDKIYLGLVFSICAAEVFKPNRNKHRGESTGVGHGALSVRELRPFLCENGPLICVWSRRPSPRLQFALDSMSYECVPCIEAPSANVAHYCHCRESSYVFLSVLFWASVQVGELLGRAVGGLDAPYS